MPQFTNPCHISLLFCKTDIELASFCWTFDFFSRYCHGRILLILSRVNLLHKRVEGFKFLSFVIYEFFFQREWYNNNYLDEQQSFLVVSFIVYLTSLIFQQYRIGFIDEFK